MCGFAALFQTGRRFPPELLSGIEADLYHRGPDSGGIVSESSIALVFRRLAILDPHDAADQPMSDPEGRYTLVFNGEIYNFLELRKTLEAQGVTFRTNGDTEVLLHGYRLWGTSVLDRLEGMYAFVIVDRQEQKVLAARDPFGIKPLYIAKTPTLVAFASEMRPLQRLVGTTPDPIALSELLTFGFAAGRLSNLKNIDRVPGGIAISFSLSDVVTSEQRFCDPLATLEPDESLTEKSVQEMVLEELEKSVRTHSQSDVGYTAQLSGGVDSSLIVALSASATNEKLMTFGVNLGDYKYDEREYRNQVIDRYQVDHHEVRLTGTDFAAAIPRAVHHMEGPTPHSGCVMLMLLCDRIREHSKVVLTGEGADEMFGGYMRYGLWRQLARQGRLASLVPEKMWRLLQRYRELQRYSRRDAAIFGSVQHDFLSMWQLFPELIPEDGWRHVMASRFRDFRDRLFAVDQSTYLESLLIRQDKMAMAASVEARVPFTHLPLARMLNRIPHRIRVPGRRSTKPVLKRVAEPYLPRDLIYRRKVGLVLPLVEWTADEQGLGRFLECLTASDCRLAQYTSLADLRTVVDAFRLGRRAGLPSLPHLVNVELWLRSLPGSTSLPLH